MTDQVIQGVAVCNEGHGEVDGPGRFPRRSAGAAAVTREDRELLAELGRLNRDVVPLAIRMMDESVHVSAAEQYTFAQRLIVMAARLQVRASRPWEFVCGEGDVAARKPPAKRSNAADSGEQRV